MLSCRLPSGGCRSRCAFAGLRRGLWCRLGLLRRQLAQGDSDNETCVVGTGDGVEHQDSGSGTGLDSVSDREESGDGDCRSQSPSARTGAGGARIVNHRRNPAPAKAGTRSPRPRTPASHHHPRRPDIARPGRLLSAGRTVSQVG